MADGTASLGKPAAPVEPLNRGRVCWYFGQPCSTANDIAAPMRRNETRLLSLMSAIQVDSATAESGRGVARMERSAIRGSRRAVSRISLRSIRATTLANGSDAAILLFVAI